MRRVKLIQRFIADELGRILFMAVLLLVPGSILFTVMPQPKPGDGAAILFSIGFLWIGALFLREFISDCRKAWVNALPTAKSHQSRDQEVLAE